MNRRAPLLLSATPVLLAVLLAGCGNKGPLVLPPPPSEDDQLLLEADAVDDAGVLADPTPADTDAQPLPPARPPVEGEPEPDPEPPAGAAGHG